MTDIMTDPRYIVKLRDGVPGDVLFEGLENRYDPASRTFEALSMEVQDTDDPSINFRITVTDNVTVWEADIAQIRPTEEP